MMAKNIKDDPDDNFDNMDIPAVNFFVTQPALHYALSWWKFWCLKDLCTISQTTTNYQPIKATRAPECRHMSCLGLQGVVEHPINQSFNQSNNQQINQSNLPEYRHLNCPGLQGGVGQDDGSSLPSMQSVDPSQYLGFHYNNEDMIKISKI